jgi:hypothetical protein
MPPDRICTIVRDHSQTSFTALLSIRCINLLATGAGGTVGSRLGSIALQDSDGQLVAENLP